jgi:hypothetical protein
VESDLSAAAKKLELAKVGLGRYPETVAEFPDFKLTKPACDTVYKNTYYCLDKVNQRYAVGIRSKSLKGYILDTGTITSGMPIGGEPTCNAIGKTWANNATTAAIQGYTATPTPVWNPSWSWTRE